MTVPPAGWGDTGLQWVPFRDATEHPHTEELSSHKKSLSSPARQSTKAGKLSFITTSEIQRQDLWDMSVGQGLATLTPFLLGAYGQLGKRALGPPVWGVGLCLLVCGHLGLLLRPHCTTGLKPSALPLPLVFHSSP